MDGIITLCPGNIKRRTMGYFLGWFAFQIFYFHLNEFNLVGNCWISTLALDCLETNLFQRHRSSPPVVFLGKGVLKICSKFTGEHPCRIVISIKLACNFIEITLRHGCLSVNLLYISQHLLRTPLKGCF